MSGPYVLEYAVCLWTHLTWWLAALSFTKKSLPDNFARFESCDCLWTFKSIILTDMLEFCLGFAVAFILGIISVSDTWSLTDKVTLVLMWSFLPLTFFFIKAASLVYLLPMYCSHFEEWFFFYSGSIISCDSHPLCLWLLTHLPQTFPSFAGVKPPHRMQTLTAMFWLGMDFISTFIIPIVLAVLFA